ncbi:MAG: hypothetical protein M3O02_09970 [Acidobacteriota bacterium]|nr:hypothetical protein [Acidobacteriota bacterium]
MRNVLLALAMLAGSAVLPAQTKINMQRQVTGTLQPVNGGTGQTVVPILGINGVHGTVTFAGPCFSLSGSTFTFNCTGTASSVGSAGTTQIVGSTPGTFAGGHAVDNGTTYTFSEGVIAPSVTVNDTVNNGQVILPTGSGGDSTCPVQTTAGSVALCVKAGLLQLSQASAASGAYLPVPTATGATPATSSDVCVPPQIKYDASYLYLCTAANTWKRTAISTF